MGPGPALRLLHLWLEYYHNTDGWSRKPFSWYLRGINMFQQMLCPERTVLLSRGTDGRCGRWSSPRSESVGRWAQRYNPPGSAAPEWWAAPRGCGGPRYERARWTPAPPCWSPAGQSPGQKSPSSPGCHHRKPLQTIDKHNSLAIVYNAYPQRCLRRPAIHLARYIRNLVDFFQEIVECRFRPLLFLTFLFL